MALITRKIFLSLREIPFSRASETLAISSIQQEIESCQLIVHLFMISSSSGQTVERNYMSSIKVQTPPIYPNTTVTKIIFSISPLASVCVKLLPPSTEKQWTILTIYSTQAVKLKQSENANNL